MRVPRTSTNGTAQLSSPNATCSQYSYASPLAREAAPLLLAMEAALVVVALFPRVQMLGATKLEVASLALVVATTTTELLFRMPSRRYSRGMLEFSMPPWRMTALSLA